MALIVELKDAPAALARPSNGARAADSARDELLDVLRHAGVAAVPGRPVGRSARLVDFDRRLAADEAQRFAALLRARPGGGVGRAERA